MLESDVDRLRKSWRAYILNCRQNGFWHVTPMSGSANAFRKILAWVAFFSWWKSAPWLQVSSFFPSSLIKEAVDITIDFRWLPMSDFKERYFSTLRLFWYLNQTLINMRSTRQKSILYLSSVNFCWEGNKLDFTMDLELAPTFITWTRIIHKWTFFIPGPTELRKAIMKNVTNRSVIYSKSILLLKEVYVCSGAC